MPTVHQALCRSWKKSSDHDRYSTKRASPAFEAISRATALRQGKHNRRWVFKPHMRCYSKLPLIPPWEGTSKQELGNCVRMPAAHTQEGNVK